MNTKQWPRDWQDELDVLLEHAVLFRDTAARRIELLAGLYSASEGGREWAKLLLDDFHNVGADKLLKRFDDQKRRVALLDHEGRLLNKPRVVGKAKRTTTGAPIYQRELITAMSWEELRELRQQRLRQVQAASDTVVLIDKLLELHIMCPEATDPQDAAIRLGLDLDEWLTAA